MSQIISGVKRIFTHRLGQALGLVGVIAVIWYSVNTLWLSASPKLELTGLVQAKEVNNASRFGGRVKKVWVKEGDWVEAGQKLVSFEDVEIRSKIAEAKGALTQAKARLSLLASGADPNDLRQAQSQVNQARQNLNMLQKGPTTEETAQMEARLNEARGRFSSAQSASSHADSMLEEGIISQQKYQDLQNQLRTAESQLKAAEAQKKQLQTGNRPEQVRIARAQLQGVQAQYAKLAKGSKSEELQIAQAAVDQADSTLQALEAQLSETELTAPISGVVTILNVNPGELVAPTKPIVSMINYKALWADIYVPENALQYVKAGQTVQIASDVYKGTTFQGRVAFISPKSEFIPNNATADNPDEQSSFRVKVEVSHMNSEGTTQLHPGMKVKIRF